QNGINTLFLTTSLFNQHARLEPAMFRTLRHLVFGGETADPVSVSLVLQHGRPGNLVNGYGPTETTTFAVCHRIERVQGPRVPIGRPIANTHAYILDKETNPVPVSVTGELYIGGPGVALGYLNSPELTAERFLSTPYGRLYKTGDLARWMPDGTIDYLGRTDKQIKLRGFRIEPGEIESVLGRIPGVSRCAVTAREISAGDRRLIAYYISDGTAELSAAILKETLTHSLPAFMVPNAFVEVSEFPLTANGKLAVDHLPAPTVECTVQDTYAAPRNALQAQMIEIWEELLKRPHVGIRDNFFNLGGHSLLAARMLAQVEQRFGKRPPFSALFENPTIEHLAGILLSEQQEIAREQPYVGIHADGSLRPFFFLHGDYVGGGFFCRNLAQRIGTARPFYAVHPHGLTGDRPKSTVEMAAERKRH
ncbi:MAG: non-ribosomal peptide synthetase, partial [Verrucomicrobiaceae bacterium]